MKGLLFLRKDPLAAAGIVFLFAIGLAGLPYMQVGEWLTRDRTLAPLAGMVVCRAVALAVALLLYAQLAFDEAPRSSSLRRAAWAIPALAVALNNAPIVALAEGTAGVTASWGAIALFALQCVFVAAFEEICFRAIVFPLIAERTGTGVRARIAAVVLSSALFGAAHLLNAAGAGVGAAALQAGYSFLIGAMLCVVLLATGSVAICIALHAIYNFCGMLVPTLGFGAFADIWNVPTIVMTAVIALFAVAFYAAVAVRLPARRVRALFYLSARRRFFLRIA